MPKHIFSCQIFKPCSNLNTLALVYAALCFAGKPCLSTRGGPKSGLVLNQRKKLIEVDQLFEAVFIKVKLGTKSDLKLVCNVFPGKG